MVSEATKTRLIQKVRRALGAPEPALQCAVLPWRRGKKGVEVMLITSRGTGRWVLPKGWPEKGETLCEAAEREAAEEAGIAGRATPDPIGFFLYDKVLANGMTRLCEVRVFAMQVKDMVKRWPEKDVRNRVWVSPATASTMVAEADLAELLANFRGKPKKHAA